MQPGRCRCALISLLHYGADPVSTNLRDTLLVLSPVESGPGNAAGVLALEEQALGLAVLEAEDLAVATDVELAL